MIYKKYIQLGPPVDQSIFLKYIWSLSTAPQTFDIS